MSGFIYSEQGSEDLDTITEQLDQQFPNEKHSQTTKNSREKNSSISGEICSAFDHLTNEEGFHFDPSAYCALFVAKKRSVDENGYKGFPYVDQYSFTDRRKIQSLIWNLYIHNRMSLIRLIGTHFLEGMTQKGNEQYRRQTKYLLQKTTYLKHLLFSPDNINRASDYLQIDRPNSKRVVLASAPNTPSVSRSSATPSATPSASPSVTPESTNHNKRQKTERVQNSDRSENLITGIDLLMYYTDDTISTKTGMTYDAFVQANEELHNRIKNNYMTGSYYKKILSLTKMQDQSFSEIVEKKPWFASVFLFFLKSLGKIDLSVVPEKQKNEMSFFNINHSDEFIAKNMIRTVFTELSITDLINLSNADFEALLGKLDNADPEFIKKFWEIFEIRGVHKSVIANQSGCVPFMIKYFKELNINKFEVNLELMTLILSAVSKHLPEENAKLQSFPWYASASAIEALTKAPEKKSLPKPNVTKAHELGQQLESETSTGAPSLGDWLKGTQTCGLSASLARQKINIDDIVKIFDEIGAPSLEDLKGVITSEQDGKMIIDELKTRGVKLIQANLIVKALLTEFGVLTEEKK